MEKPNKEIAENDIKSEVPDQATNSKVETPKKSKKGCCIVALVIGLLLMISLGQGVFGFGLLPWSWGSNDSTIIPRFLNRPETSSLTSSVESSTSTSSSVSETNSSATNSSSTNVAGGAASSVASSSERSQSSTPSVAEPQTVFTKQEQIDFFVQVAMKNDQNNFATIPIQKWETNSGTTAKIRYYNDPTGTNLTCADATISQINALSNTIHFSKTTGNDYDIRLYFVPKSQIGSGVGGYYNFSTDANHYVTGGNAYVPSDTYNDADRCHYIRHEMTHVMTGLAYNGLKNHGGYDFSIFNVTVGRSDYLEIDKYAIKIMLNSGVGLGWNETQVRNHLATATW